MNELPRPLFFRRVLAWFLDTVLWIALAGVLVTFFSPLGQYAQSPARFVESTLSALKKTSFGEAVRGFEGLQIKPDDWKIIGKEVDKAFNDFLAPRLKDPGKIFSLKPEDFQGFQTMLTKGLTANPQLTPDTIKKVVQVNTQVLQGISRWNFASFMQDMTTVLAPLLLFPLWVLLGYFLLEGLFGASPGKFLLGLRVASQDGHPGSPLVTLPRYLGKFFGWIICLVGLMLAESWLVFTGLAVALLLQLTCIAILWGRRQPLYDRMTRTSVFQARSLIHY